ncbi:MAG: hypothetical protein HON90_16180 [Halobacteriovoraceae bacterium]|nr:hypothetical protein [Halobacteriovoraceae bacterium]
MIQLTLAKDKIDNLVVSCKTSKHTIKINKQEGALVYSSWVIGKDSSDKPDLILNNGTWKRDGTGGNGKYDFQNKDYKHVIQDGTGVCVEYCGYYLEIYLKEKKILVTKCRPGAIKKESQNKRVNMDNENNKNKKKKRGVSGFGLFINQKLAELRRTGNPYKGDSASKDFTDEWKALTPEEQEKYDNQSTSK